jgi:hypothetical protein
MKKLLQKIEWKTNGWDYKLSILNIHLHSSFVYWGLELMTFEIQSKEYSLIKLLWVLPNKAERNSIRFSGDFLFLHEYLYEIYDDMRDSQMMNSSIKRSILYKLKYNLLRLIFNGFNN